MSDDWSNDKDLNIRQKLALQLIILAIRIINPYKFNHEFGDAFADLRESITGRVAKK